MKLCNRAVLIAASMAAVATAANATVTFNISQSGSNVVATASGSLNLTGLTDYESSTGGKAQMDPSLAFAEVGGGIEEIDGYIGLSSYPASFGPGGYLPSSSGSGDPFAVYGAYAMVWLPAGYVSGNPISGTATWLNQSIASLGLTPGTYTFAAPNDSVVVNIEGAVPEPATWAMLLIGFGAIGLVLRRRGPRDERLTKGVSADPERLRPGGQSRVDRRCRL